MKFSLTTITDGEHEGQPVLKIRDGQGRDIACIWPTDDGRGIEIVSRFHEGNVDEVAGSPAKKVIRFEAWREFGVEKRN